MVALFLPVIVSKKNKQTKKNMSFISQGECSLDPLKKLVVEIIAFLSTLGSLETDSGWWHQIRLEYFF